MIETLVRTAESSTAAKRERTSTSLVRSWLPDLYLAGLMVLVFVVDQVSKAWVRDHLLPGTSIPAEGLFRITHTSNTGSAFGLFPNQTFVLMLASVLGIAVLVIFYRRQPAPAMWLRTSLGLQLGGAAGNLADRITMGKVTDFIDVGIWPVFNLADSSIVVGIGILAWFLLFHTPKPTRSETGQPQPEERATLPEASSQETNPPDRQ
ncbi:MAG: signal peptidase II [Chloroflexi bacterium]|nr:signal peptidase II [Chloroflexota bacterium]